MCSMLMVPLPATWQVASTVEQRSHITLLDPAVHRYVDVVISVDKLLKVLVEVSCVYSFAALVLGVLFISFSSALPPLSPH